MNLDLIVEVGVLEDRSHVAATQVFKFSWDLKTVTVVQTWEDLQVQSVPWLRRLKHHHHNEKKVLKLSQGFFLWAFWPGSWPGSVGHRRGRERTPCCKWSSASRTMTYPPTQLRPPSMNNSRQYDGWCEDLVGHVEESWDVEDALRHLLFQVVEEDAGCPDLVQ